MKQTKISLKNGFLAMIILCWLVPIMVVMSLSGYLLGNSYQESAQQELDDSADYALRQVQRQMEDAIHDSKGVSYDGVIRNSYREYLEHGDRAELYRIANDYLTQKFSRSPEYQAIFLSFWNRQTDADVYLFNNTNRGYDLLRECKQCTPDILESMRDADTQIRFLLRNGNLYLARNLLDSQFHPYATVVMMLDPQVVFESLNGLRRIEQSVIHIDDLAFFVSSDGTVISRQEQELQDGDVCYSASVGSHCLKFTATPSEYNLVKENPLVLWLVCGVALMVLPLTFVFISLFHRHITRPMETLVHANQLVQSGKRGYEIEEESPNVEFSKLYSHFNAMSTELDQQFKRSYLEQQASQRAQIKALQSQINPHFLNNTLEIINWEARLAGNDRISAMIEALSTMLGAALDRKGRTQIPVREELGYVDAYLYIIHQRVGDSFHVHKDIAPETETLLVPRLILQPIVENAVEHDIAPNHGGNLWVRAYGKDSRLILDVEHDGSMSVEDLEKIRAVLTEEKKATRVGLHNVYQRLKLIYGCEGSMKILETDHGTVLARISFPCASDRFMERSNL